MSNGKIHLVLGIAFDKGSSSGSGTLNTINAAKKLYKEVIVINKEK